MTDWPKSLQAWEPELRVFAHELLGSLAPLCDRLAHAIGPLRISTERRSDEPNGYSALSRRGPYERLLISEWALQLEHEDEFIRRATSGEHLFVELDRRSPAVALEAWLLLDTGPSQLGTPRIAHLAAVLAFTRRAREAGVVLHWAPLWSFELPPHEALNQATLQTWLSARTAWEPNAGVLDRWSSQWPEREDVERDVWLIGSESTAQLARERGWSSIAVDDSAGDGIRALELRVTPARKRRTTTVQVTLPAVPLQVRLLRDPFDWSRPKPPGPSKTPGKKRAIPLLPTTELAFSHDGHRLLARTEAGSVVAIPIRNSASASYGWPTPAELPLQTSLVAAVWGSRRARALVVAKGDGSIHLAAWDGSMGVPLVPSAPRPLPHELFIASWPARQGWQMRGTWFDAANTARVDASLLTARAFGSWVGRVIEGPRLESNASGHLRTLTLPLRPEKVWLSWEGPLAAACLHSDRLDVHFVVTNSDLSTQVHTRSLPRALFSRDDLIQGLYVGAGPKLEVTVIALQPDRRTVRSLNIFGVAPQWNEVTRPRNQLAAFALSPHGRYFAWRDVEGEIAVFSRDRGAVVLRLHTSNVAVERP